MKKIILAIILSLSFSFGSVDYYRVEITNEMGDYSLFRVVGSPFLIELESCYRSAFREKVLMKLDSRDARNNSITFDDDGREYRIIKIWR